MPLAVHVVKSVVSSDIAITNDSVGFTSWNVGAAQAQLLVSACPAVHTATVDGAPAASRVINSQSVQFARSATSILEILLPVPFASNVLLVNVSVLLGVTVPVFVV